MSNGYDIIARVYDKLMDEIDYKAWANYVSEVILRYSSGRESVCELGCGTGLLTKELADMGYDMIGVDLSEGMLSEAHNRLVGTGSLLLCQDMKHLDLYGTVDAVVCCMDGINHLVGKDDFEKTAARAALFLNEGGIFAFDVNSKYRYETVYSDNDYVLEGDGVVCCWRNNYDGAKEICDFNLAVFEEDADGRYRRSDGVIRERCYSHERICEVLTKSGFEVVALYGNTDFSPAGNTSEKVFYVAKKTAKN